MTLPAVYGLDQGSEAAVATWAGTSSRLRGAFRIRRLAPYVPAGCEGAVTGAIDGPTFAVEARIGDAPATHRIDAPCTLRYDADSASVAVAPRLHLHLFATMPGGACHGLGAVELQYGGRGFRLVDRLVPCPVALLVIDAAAGTLSVLEPQALDAHRPALLTHTLRAGRALAIVARASLSGPEQTRTVAIQGPGFDPAWVFGPAAAVAQPAPAWPVAPAWMTLRRPA